MEAIGKLAGGVAHDFNNLLTVIIGYSEILLMSLLGRSDRRASSRRSRKAGDRAAGLDPATVGLQSQADVLSSTCWTSILWSFDMEKMLRRLIGEDIDLMMSLGPGAVAGESGSRGKSNRSS